MRLLTIILIIFGFNHHLAGQDTLRVMYYNLLNFPGDSPERITDLRVILNYAKPDILVVNEVTSGAAVSLILDEALNVYGHDGYVAADYVDGPDTDNLLFYNQLKIGLINQVQIPTGLRDISEYLLYYKRPGMTTEMDTIYLRAFSLHLKAGSGFYNQRKEEALVLKYRLNDIDHIENILVGGDFNFYSGFESGCGAILNTGDVDLYDPIDAIGNWHNNGVYAYLHTQSTRTSALADGAGGGLDDRFDLIFCSADVLTNENGIEFIADSYRALGQDGSRFNGAINSPANFSVPDSVSDALYAMSDHLPVLMDLKTDKFANIIENQVETIRCFYRNITHEVVIQNNNEPGIFFMYDASGKLVAQLILNSETKKVSLANHLSTGIYLWNFQNQNRTSSGKLGVY